MMDGGHHPAAAASSSDLSGSGDTNNSANFSEPSSTLYSFHLEKPTASPPPPQGKQQQLQPPPGTNYVVQIPKDKIFRVPPPQNARLFEHYTRRAKRRNRGCGYCLRVFSLYLFAAVVALACVLAASAAILCLVCQPKLPSYALQSFAVSGLDGGASASAAVGTFSPAFVATVRADNLNGRIGVHYGSDGSRLAVSFAGVRLASGAWPAIYQEPRNVTVLAARARGSGIRFSESVLRQMATAARLRSVPFDVDVKVPVRLQLGGVKTWAVPVGVRCVVAVDSLAGDAKVVSRSCDVKVGSMFWTKLATKK